jgi:SAM-dependent methyltransferase
MNPPSPVTTAVRLIGGYQISRAIYVALELGVFDKLKKEPSSDALAAEIGAHAPSLYRLLRALAGVGVLHEEPERRFTLTPVGDCFRSDAPGSVGAAALSAGQPYYWHAWSELGHSIRTGEPAFIAAHGTTAWQYRAQHPEAQDAFNRAMTATSRRMAASIILGYDFARFGTVVDVGGGAGALLAAILRRNRNTNGILFDLPEAVGAATAQLEAAGVADRARCVGGSFFEALPGEGDAYVLCSVLHNWQDADAIKILTSCRRAMKPEARVLVVESEVGEPNADPEVKLLDLNMLVIHGALERTRQEYQALMEAAGLEWVGAVKTPGGMTILEGRAR